MRKYETPALTVVELKPEAMLIAESMVIIPLDPDDYADIEDETILPNGALWD